MTDYARSHSVLDSEDAVALYTNANSLPGTGGVDISKWKKPGDGVYPDEVMLTFTNNDGAGNLTIGSVAAGPAVLKVGGKSLDPPLFGSFEVVIPPGESLVTEAPFGAAGIGQTWAIDAATTVSAGAVNVTVIATPIYRVKVS